LCLGQVASRGEALGQGKFLRGRFVNDATGFARARRLRG
jgi:hypothetical protein